MRVKYVGGYYKALFDPEISYEVIGIEMSPKAVAYRVLLHEIDDDGLFFSGDFEIVDDSGYDELMASAVFHEK